MKRLSGEVKNNVSSRDLLCYCGKKISVKQIFTTHEDCMLREMATRLGKIVLNRKGKVIIPSVW